MHPAGDRPTSLSPVFQKRAKGRALSAEEKDLLSTGTTAAPEAVHALRCDRGHGAGLGYFAGNRSATVYRTDCRNTSFLFCGRQPELAPQPALDLQKCSTQDHPILQWLRFLAANSFGFLLNRGTVYTLCFTVPFCAQHVALPLAAGSLMGLLANFNLSRKLVFRAKVPETPLELAKMTVDLNVDPTDKDLES